jgi:hypothetical protein
MINAEALIIYIIWSFLFIFNLSYLIYVRRHDEDIDLLMFICIFIGAPLWFIGIVLLCEADFINYMDGRCIVLKGNKTKNDYD